MCQRGKAFHIRRLLLDEELVRFSVLPLLTLEQEQRLDFSNEIQVTTDCRETIKNKAKKKKKYKEFLYTILGELCGTVLKKEVGRIVSD